MIVVALDTHTLPEGVMRLSLANGYGLCNAPIDVRDIDTITECVWDANANKWIVSYLYMKQLAEHDVSGTKGNTLRDYTRVATLVIRARNSEGLRLAEEELFVRCTGMLSGNDQEQVEERCERDPDDRCSAALHAEFPSINNKSLFGDVRQSDVVRCVIELLRQEVFHAWCATAIFTCVRRNQKSK